MRTLLVCCAAVLVVGDIAVASSERGLSVSRCGGVTGSRRRAHALLLVSLPPVLRELGVRMAKDRERQTDTGPGGTTRWDRGIQVSACTGSSSGELFVSPLFSRS